jgi:hypothetical protein
MGTRCGSGQPGSEKGWRVPSAPVRLGLVPELVSGVVAWTGWGLLAGGVCSLWPR